MASALEAAKRLAESGIEATVVNARFLKPLDSTLILDVAHRTKRVVTVEENALWGGFGGAVLDLLQGSSIPDLQVERIGLPDEFVEHGQQGLLRAKYNLDADGIVKRVVSSFPQLSAHPSMEAGN